MVDHEIQHHRHSAGVALLDQALHLLERAFWWVDGFIVADVVAHIDLWAVVHGTEPCHADSEVFDVFQLLNDAGDVSDAVAVGVVEAGRVDLVENP